MHVRTYGGKLRFGKSIKKIEFNEWKIFKNMVEISTDDRPCSSPTDFLLLSNFLIAIVLYYAHAWYLLSRTETPGAELNFTARTRLPYS